MGKTLEECYEVLGLEYGAIEGEIKSAYRKKALQCHPDKNPDDPLSTQKFQELGHAYRRLTGEEDSDSDDEFDDDDMELWRDFFFFLFRDEILARVRCKCYKCGRVGENEDDDFLASLAKEQEERCQFTEEEMAQFRSFTSLKEQREANKKKFCDRNQATTKPEQKATKANKPKLKTNKQLKVEQWKREKEISEIAAQINQPNPKVQGKKDLSKDVKTKELHQQKSFVHPGVAAKEKVVKEHTEGGSNKRNARKKKNRNKQRQQSDRETDTNQNDDFTKTTLNEQKLASSFVVQDAVKNVTIKPETTRRQDDVTGRLPRYTRFISPRMMKARARAQDSTLNSHKNVQEKQTGRGWFETQKPETAPRPSYGANNIWQKRQEKQQFLSELQPSNQNDEELQLQMALELSKKQAEIEAQQREISMLEKQMEETLQIEKQLEQITDEEENQGVTATLTGPDSFPPQGFPVGCEPASSEVEDWEAASDSEDEWQESEQASNFSGEYASNDDDEASGQIHETKYNGLPLEEVTSSDKENMTVPKSNVQLPQPSGGQDSQALDCCPYGKNCCLGKRCMYSHPSVDNRKSQQSVEDSSSSQDQCDPESADECNLISDLTVKHIAPTASCEELPGTSEHGHPGDNTWQSYNPYNCNESITNSSLHPLQPQTSANYEPETASDDTYATQQAINAGDLVKFGSTTSVGKTGFSKDENQCHLASDKLENISQSLSPGLESQSSLEDKSSSSQEKSKTDNANDLQIRSNGHLNTLNGAPGDVNNGNSTAKEASAVDSNATGPTVYVIADQSQFPFGLPAASALMQSAAALPPLGNLSAGANLLNSPQNSSSLPLNYANQMSSALPANLIAQTLTAHPQSSGPAVTATTSQNSASPSLGATRQTPTATSQPNTVAFSTSTQTAATNGFPAEPGFPFHQSFGATRQTPTATPQPNTVASSTSTHTAATNGFPAVPGFPFLPNVFPFLNPANLAANASLMAAAAGGLPFPIMPGPSNSMHNQQGGGFMMNQPMLPPYLKTDLAGGVPPLGQYLPMQAQLNGFPVMTGEGSGQLQRPTQAQPQPSQAGVTNEPRSAAPTVPQPLRFPFPFIDPQAFVNMNAAMAMGLPYSMLQNGCQTSLHSGLAPSHAQVNNKTTEQCRVEHTGTGVTKPTDIKSELGEGRGGSVSCDSKTPSLRRPVTVPKVIQHQASK